MPATQNIETRITPGAADVKLTGGLPQPRILMNGKRLDIQASVDLKGLKRLQEMLTKYQSILEMMEADEAAN